MSKNNNTIAILKILGVGIAVIQLLDITIHAATGQLEILRVSSNVVILLWLTAMASGRFNVKFPAMAVSAIGSYLILNVIFLIREGLTNVEQGGRLRITLLLLVFLTTALSTLLTYTCKNR